MQLTEIKNTLAHTHTHTRGLNEHDTHSSCKPTCIQVVISSPLLITDMQEVNVILNYEQLCVFTVLLCDDAAATVERGLVPIFHQITF